MNWINAYQRRWKSLKKIKGRGFISEVAWGLPGGFCVLGDVWALPGAGRRLQRLGWGPPDAFLPWMRPLLRLSEGLLEAACILPETLLASQLPAYFFSQEGTGVMDAPGKVLNWLGTSYPRERLWHLVCFKLLRWGSGWQLPWSRLVTVLVWFFFFSMWKMWTSHQKLIHFFSCLYFFYQMEFFTRKIKKKFTNYCGAISG